LNRVNTLDLARDQLVLALLVRSVCSGGAGRLETSVVVISKGPWFIGEREISGLDRDRAAWGLEMIAAQNLAIALDTALELKIPNRLEHDDNATRDYCCFVRCLRNAFTHAPYRPRWVLSNPR
jgi:hypothetical protein